MLTVQLGVSAAGAFARLRAYAYAQDRRLADVARPFDPADLRIGQALADVATIGLLREPRPDGARGLRCVVDDCVGCSGAGTVVMHVKLTIFARPRPRAEVGIEEDS